jgi:hypothetical protein
MANAAHGRSHAPESEDPTYTGRWHNVGDAGEPTLTAGSNIGGSSVPMRFRIATGRPNVLDDSGAIAYYCDKQLDFEGDMTGLLAGDTVFTLPPEFRLDYDVPVNGHDDLGNHVACRLYTDGRYVYGVP